MDQITITLNGNKLQFKGRLTESQVKATNAMYTKRLCAESFLATGIKLDINTYAKNERCEIKGRLFEFSCDLPEIQAEELKKNCGKDLAIIREMIVADVKKILGLYELK